MHTHWMIHVLTSRSMTPKSILRWITVDPIGERQKVGFGGSAESFGRTELKLVLNNSHALMTNAMVDYVSFPMMGSARKMKFVTICCADIYAVFM